MKFEGGCYCGSLRYSFEGDALFQGECFCRECQYISGGNSNLVLGVTEPGFSYTSGSPKGFSRSDLEGAVTREFCEACGTHILAKAPSMPGALMLKVGTMDQPSPFEGAQMAIFTVDKQGYHRLPEDVPVFEGLPG